MMFYARQLVLLGLGDMSMHSKVVKKSLLQVIFLSSMLISHMSVELSTSIAILVIQQRIYILFYVVE